MALTTDQLKRLSRLYDRWQSGDAPERIAIQHEIDAGGEDLARVFIAMMERADTVAGSTLLPPIPQAMREHAMRAISSADIDATDARPRPHTHTHTVASATLSDAPPTREPGQHVGPYRLIKELGRGGMGVVWLAERADGQHHRQVALKMPLVENLNWLLAARFARERNILASLEHPSIARLYDAGVDQVDRNAQPYIAIEYVQGVPITDYVKEKRLKPEATALLFIRVIEAVAHAHTQLVIHRDIKPSNILVDAKGEPHLLDFGIAKLLDDEDSQGADATQLTRLSGRALTLDYASPEQVNNAPLGVASDIYALGVVLFELLTGSRPYQPKGPTRRDLELAILEQEPRKPSDHLLATGDSESGKSARRVRGDLDTIVLKALRKDAKQRYATAQAFADDLKRYIGFEPIAARPQGVVYRIGKYARRHRVAITSTFLGLAALLTIGVFALRQQQQAQASLGRADAVDSLLRHLFRGMSPDVAATRAFTANELLDRTAQFIDSDTLLDAATRRSTHRTMGVLYNEIGEYDKAMKRFSEERAEAARVGDRARVARALAQLTEAQTNAAGTELTKLAVAEKYSDELQAVVEAGVPDGAVLAAKLSYLRGQIERSRNQPKLALARFDDAERRLRVLTGIEVDDLLADTLRAKGYAAADTGDIATARNYLSEALTRYRAANERKTVAALETSSLLARLRLRQGQFKLAIEAIQAVLIESQTRLGSNHPITLDVLNSLATASVRVGDFATARSAALRVRTADAPDSAERRRIDDFVNARIAMYSGNVAAAEQAFRALYEAAPATSGGRSFVALLLAEALLRGNRLDDVSGILETVDRTSGDQLVSRSGRVLVARLLRACLHAKRGELNVARALVAPVIVVLKQDFSDDYYVLLVAQAYELLWSEEPVSAQDALRREALASRIERELAWQHGAAELAQWLRQRPAKAKWSEMPIVL